MNIERRLIPSRQFIYFKLFTSELLADEIIIDIYNHLFNSILHQYVIKTFFFVRYSDPSFHLRVRFFLNNENDYTQFSKVIDKILKRLYKEKKIWKVQIDTYEREVERYKLLPISRVELFFFKESVFLIEILKIIKNNNEKNENELWKIIIWIMDMYLSSCGINIESKTAFSELMSDVYKKEFGFDYYNSKCLNTTYSTYKTIIHEILLSKENIEKMGIPIHLLTEFENTCREFFSSINKEDIIKTDSIDFQFMHSIIHMLVNRAFTHYNRLHEMLLYFFLWKFYKSQLFITNNKPVPL